MGAVLPLPSAGARSVCEHGLEPFFTAREVANYLGIDESTARRIFLDYPGVLKLGRTCAGDGRRSYVTIRVPLSVLKQFIEERSR